MEVVIGSPLGNIKIAAEADHLTQLSYSVEQKSAKPENPLLISAITQLDEYFHGNRKTFELALNPKGTEFQRKVWDELLKIPFGATISYLELANRLGDVKSIRAAASANGKNPIAIIIPCHRVIGSDGDMTGYAGGIDKKRALLKLEGANVMNQLDIF